MLKKTLLSTAASFYSLQCLATTYTVNTTDGGTPSGTAHQGNLSYCISQAQSGDLIDCSPISSNTITLTNTLPQITQDITISGSTITIDGASTYPGFLILSGTVSIQDLTVQNAHSIGGSGGSSNGAPYSGGAGGGGSGAGGGLFIRSGTSVNLRNLDFLNNQAIGGAGGVGDGSGISSSGNFGGGGGGGGSLNHYTGGNGVPGGGIGGGGGGGNSGPSAPDGLSGNGNIGGGGGIGGNGGISGSAGENGNIQGGGGGGGGTDSQGPLGGMGGDGALFGGGGGGGFGYAGSGGNGGNGGKFSGGGGGGTAGVLIGGAGGSGAFGGGGGGGGGSGDVTIGIGGSSAFGGGNGGNGFSDPISDLSGGGGGGGAALGGAIFIEKNATLTLLDQINLSGNTVTAGTGGIGGSGADAGSDGLALGPDLFLSSGGTLIVDINTTPLTISSVIASDQGADGGTGGGLIKRGSETLTLLGNNIYTGGTKVIEGLLSINSSNNIGGSSSPLSLEGGGLSLTGEVTISGDVTINSDTSFILNSNNATFTGSIICSSDSILSITEAGSAIFSIGNVEVLSDSILSIDHEIAGAQDLILTGDGTGILAIINATYTGITTVSESTLLLNGSITSPITLQSGGKLKGTGEIINSITVNNGGTLSPGNSSGIINVSENVTFGSGSTFNVDCDANGISQLLVSGNVVIDSGAILTITALDGFSVDSALDTSIIEATSLSGTFTSVVKDAPLLHTSLVYSSNSLLLKFSLAEFRTLNLIGNPLAVGTTLDEVVDSGSSILNPVIDTLTSFTTAEISSALNQMQPSLFKGLTISQENNAVKVRDSLGYRMQNELDRKSCYSFVKNPKDSSKNIACSENKQTIHAWVDGFGDILNQKSTTYAESYQFGYQNKTAGVAVGLDGNFADYFYAGALGAYTGSDIDFRNNQGSGTIETGYAGLYFSAIGKMFYGNASVIGGWNHFHGQRNVKYPGMNVKAKNNHGGAQILSHLDTGINLGFNGFTVRPFDSFDYISQSEGSYTETGAGTLNLHIQSSNAIMLRNELGLQFAGCFCFGRSNWTLSPKISWVREVRVKGAQYTAEFVNTNIPFEVTGYFPDRSLVSPGVMVSGMLWEDRLVLDLYYNGEFGQKYSDHNYGGQIKFGF